MNDEVKEEIETLACIYMDDFQQKAAQEEDEAGTQGRCEILVNASSTDPDEGGASVRLSCVFPPGYPSQQPLIANVLPAPHSADAQQRAVTKSVMRKLQATADGCAQDNLGGPAVFAAVSAVQEQMELVCFGAQEAEDEDDIAVMGPAVSGAADLARVARRQQLPNEVDLSVRVVDGTPVNEATFAEWEARFTAELESAGSQIGAQDVVSEHATHSVGPLTGREIFVRKKLKTAGVSLDQLKPGDDGAKNEEADDNDDNDDDVAGDVAGKNSGPSKDGSSVPVINAKIWEQEAEGLDDLSFSDDEDDG